MQAMTIDEARDNPEALLQASDEALHDLFSELLDRRQDVEAAVQFVAAWRQLAEIATADPRDVEAEVRVFAEQVQPRWCEHAPWVQAVPVVEIMHDGGALNRFLGTEDREEVSRVWRCLQDPDAPNPIAERRKPTVWQELWEAYRENRFGRCDWCGTLFIQKPTGRPRKFCRAECRYRDRDTTSPKG